MSCFADTEQEKEFGRKNAKLKLFLAVQVPRSYKNIKTTAGVASKHCFLESQQFVVVCCSYDRTSTNSFKDCTFHCQLYLATNIEWIEHFTATLSTDIRTQHPDTATSQETDLAKLAAHAHASWKLQ